MLTCSISESLKIWEELVTAYYNMNRFGGDTTEIYSYRLEPYTPSVHLRHKEDREMKVTIGAAKSLSILLEEFKNSHKCNIFIDDIKLSKWNKEIIHNVRHRYHIRIER